MPSKISPKAPVETAQPLFDPANLAYQGQYSSLSPLSVNPGRWVLGQNLRIGDRSIRARWGIVKTGSVPVAVGAAASPTSALGTGAYVIGADAVTCNGQIYVVSAWRVNGGGATFTGTAIVVTDVSVGSHAIVNANSGEWGDTSAISTSSYTPPRFLALSDPRSGKEYIVIVGDLGMGVYDPVGATFAVVATVDTPGDTSGFSVTPTFPKFFTVNDETTTDLTVGTAARFIAADQGAAPENYIRYTRDTTASANPTRVTTFSAAVDLSGCRQMCIIYDSMVADWWERIKVEIWDTGAAAYVTVWDPTTPNYRPEYVKVAEPEIGDGILFRPTETKMMVAFYLDHIPAASRDQVDRFRLTYQTAAPATNATCDIYMVAGSGTVIGQAYHALTYFDPFSRIESKPIFPTPQPELIANLGGPGLSHLRIPFSDKIFYKYSVGYQNTLTASQVRDLLVYRNDPGDPDPSRYSYVATVTLTSWAPSTWSFSSGLSLAILSYSDTTISDSRVKTAVAPFPGCKPPPTRNFCAATANGRFLLGRWYGSPGTPSQPFASELWASELDNPFRFYEKPYRGDSSSGGVLKFHSEVLYAIHKTSGGLLGTDALWYFTDKQLYRTSNFELFGMLNPSFVCEHGTRFPESVRSYKGNMYWMDQDYNVLKLGSTFENLSRNVIDNLFTTLLPANPLLINNAQAHKISSTFFKNIYRMALDTATTDDPSTMRKTTNALYHEDYNAWSQDVFAGSLNSQIIFQANGTLYCWGSDRFLYTMENGSQATDGGAAFAMTLTTGMIHQDFVNWLAVKRCSVLADDAANGTVSWTATYMPDASTRTSGAKSLDVSTSYVLRNLPVTQGGTGHGMGPACQILFTFTVPGGTRVYGITAYFEARQGDPANV